MLGDITPLGPLNAECNLEGLPKIECGAPSHTGTAQVSRNRWLLTFGLRAFGGIDDDRSIVYQLRADAPDGPVIKQGLLTRSFSGWDPAETGELFFKGHGSPGVFGVPKGAVVNGRVPSHANLFCVIWYCRARVEMPGGQSHGLKHAESHGAPPTDAPNSPAYKRNVGLEWVHVRLNDAEDDIELLHEPCRLHPRPYGPSEKPSKGSARDPANGLIRPYPYDDDRTEWIKAGVVEGRNTAIRFAYNAKTHRYEWVQTGPASVADPEMQIREPQLIRVGDEWVMMIRCFRKGWTAWLSTKDPFNDLPAPTYKDNPAAYCPRNAYCCPDGVLRILCGDTEGSPYGEKRNPLYMWDVNPITFDATNRRKVFDTREAGLPIEVPLADFGKLLPNQGRRQLITHRVAVGKYVYATEAYGPVTPEEVAACGTYCEESFYTEDVPAPWTFHEEDE